MEDYELISFCCDNRVCMCLATSMIHDRIGGTSLATPSIWFSVYINRCTSAVEPKARLSSQIAAYYPVHYLRPLSALPFTFVSLKGTSHYCLLLGHQSSSSGIAYRVSIGVTAFLLGQARMTLMSVSPRIGLHLNQSQPRPAVALT